MSTAIFLSIFYYSFYLLALALVFLLFWIIKRKKFSPELLLLLLVILTLIWARFGETEIFRVRNYDLDLTRSGKETQSELKVVVFSDLHLGVYKNKNFLKRLVKKVNQLEADLVLIPGDFVYFMSRDKLKEELAELSQIQAPCLVVLGNHDYGRAAKDISRDLKSALESLGLWVIDNDIKHLSVKESLIEFIGLEDIWAGNPDFDILIRDNSDETADLRLLLAHNPDTIYKLADYSKELKKIDLMVSGHTHAGQIRLPFLYRHIIPSAYGFDRGFYEVFDTKVFVSGGVGNVVLPLRLFNRPEISFINIVY